MPEGGLEPPIRHALAWQSDEFYDEKSLDNEIRRVFDICHGCRRCFNLCSSFPRLFDLIDESSSGELDSVDSAGFKAVMNDCTLCDMCFMTKCPYVPPHEFNLDFPHLVLRYRAQQNRKGEVKLAHKQLTKTDRNGRLGVMLSALMNWASARKNRPLRMLMQWFAGLSAKAELPRYARCSLQTQAKQIRAIGQTAHPAKRKVALFSGCHCNYSDTEVGRAALYLLEQFGVQTEIVYPECCGMPQLESGDLPTVAAKAERIATILRPYIDKDYDVVGLTPSCTLLMKFEWPLILPHSENCAKLKVATFDISEYIVKLSKTQDLPAVKNSVYDSGDTVSLHLACHARAQNMGQKGAELLRLLPDVKLNVVERCSGHGGAWGVMREHFDTAVKVGKPAARQMLKGENIRYITSECPLASLHLGQIIGDNGEATKPSPQVLAHPIILLARAYGMPQALH